MPEPELRLAHLEKLSNRIIWGQYVLFACVLLGALVLGIQNGKISDEQKHLKANQAAIAANQAQVKVLTNQNCRNIATLAAIQRAFIVRQEIQLNALLGSRVTGVSIGQIRRFRKANRAAENTLLFSFDALAKENCKPSKTVSLPAVIYLHKEGTKEVTAVAPLAEISRLPPLTVPLLLPRASGQPLVVSQPLTIAAAPVSVPVSSPAPSARGSPPRATPPIVPSPVRPTPTPTPAPSPPPAVTPPPKAKPPPPKEPPPKEKPKPPKEEPPPKPPKEPPGKERPPHEKHPPHEHVPPGQEKKAERPVPPGHECHGNGRKKCP